MNRALLLMGGGLHPYTRRILNRARAEGYTLPSSATIKLIDKQVVRRLVSEGVWDRMDGLWFAAYNDVSLINLSMINWINPNGNLAFHGTGVDMLPGGWKFDGTTGDPTSSATIGGGINTGWNFANDSVKLTLNDAHYSALVFDTAEITNVTNGLISGAETNGRNVWSAFSGVAQRINATTNINASVNMSGEGLKMIHRTSSADVILSNKGNEYMRTGDSSSLFANLLIGANSTSNRSLAGISSMSVGAPMPDKREILRDVYNDYLYLVGLPANA